MPNPAARRAVFTCFAVCLVLMAWMPAGAQAKPESKGEIDKDTPKAPASAPIPGAEFSGMYSFLRDGEFVQVSVEPGRVTGLVSRFSDADNDGGGFLEHFFKSGKLDGNQLTFTTEAVHGQSYEFRGSVVRGEGKNPGDEAYYVLQGALIENVFDDTKRSTPHSQMVALKSFPRDNPAPEPAKK